MFEQLFKRQFDINKHISAPLLEERINYIQSWIDTNHARKTITMVAQYLLIIVKFLSLKSTNHTVTAQELEYAANKWANYKCNHPQKQAFSKTGKKRFMWFAIDWLKKMNCLELLPEKKEPLLNQIFERRFTLKRHTSGPLLKERLSYLQYSADIGIAESGLHAIAPYLLIIMKYLNFYELRKVRLDEIKNAANAWAMHKSVYSRKKMYSPSAHSRFVYLASEWLKMLGCLEVPDKEFIPFEEYLLQYVEYMSKDQGLSQFTIKARVPIIQKLLVQLYDICKTFIDIKPLYMDEILIKKACANKLSRSTTQAQISIIRGFLKYAGNCGWCSRNLWMAIKAPRVYKHEALPTSPSWDDVKIILNTAKTDYPTDIRDFAILMLIAVYGMRRSEVANLCLEDLNWQDETIYLKRAKCSKPQIFPLSKTVGNAILKYLMQVRPTSKTNSRRVFIGVRAPYKPLDSGAIYGVVHRKIKPLNLPIKHHGPHALRHACATHLINIGVSLKEISDYLGYQGLETTRIYSKVDLTNLRKIAEFDLGDLLWN